MKIAVGSDHAGFDLKVEILEFLRQKGVEVVDFGPSSAERCDYPDFAHPVANAVESGKVDFGLLMCGSGNGINMAANKHQGIRSALCWEEEIAALARQHNDANICALPARYLSVEKSKAIVQSFISEKFEGGRHQQRINKIPV
ncbi:MAG: ribose 5-phosphate isomerase B [Flavobacteriales bacterium]|nr:ribose 5-phosphate isomerase B [Flavobacteriaceae bacterium]MCB0479848.1 ribose 5-phosphate isomerase B [Flavobacteriales bacterium]